VQLVRSERTSGLLLIRGSEFDPLTLHLRKKWFPGWLPWNELWNERIRGFYGQLRWVTQSDCQSMRVRAGAGQAALMASASSEEGELAEKIVSGVNQVPRQRQLAARPRLPWPRWRAAGDIPAHCGSAARRRTGRKPSPNWARTALDGVMTAAGRQRMPLRYSSSAIHANCAASLCRTLALYASRADWHGAVLGGRARCSGRAAGGDAGRPFGAGDRDPGWPSVQSCDPCGDSRC
jgi:hypothetical protein